MTCTRPGCIGAGNDAAVSVCVLQDKLVGEAPLVKRTRLPRITVNVVVIRARCKSLTRVGLDDHLRDASRDAVLTSCGGMSIGRQVAVRMGAQHSTAKLTPRIQDVCRLSQPVSTGFVPK